MKLIQYLLFGIIISGLLLQPAAASTASTTITIDDNRLHKLSGKMDIFIDENRQSRIADIVKEEKLIFKPFGQSNIKVIGKPIWLRFKVLNPYPHPKEFSFYIPHTWQGPLDLYQPTKNGYEIVDKTPTSSNMSTNFNIPFVLQPGINTLFINLEVSMPRFFVPEIGVSDAFNNKRIELKNVSMFITGFLTAMIIYAVYVIRNIGGESNKEAYLYFFYVFSTLLLGCYLNGYLEFLGVEILTLMYTSLVWVWTCTLAIVTLKYFTKKNQKNILNKIVLAAAIINGLFIFSMPYVKNNLWMYCFSATFIILRLLPLCIAVYFFTKKFQGAALFITAIIIDIAAIFYIASGTLDWITHSHLMLPIFELGNALSVLIIGIALSNKLQVDSLTRAKLEHEAEIARLDSHMKSDFLATMSHEIRTPINGMLGMVQLLQETPLRKDQKGKLDIIFDSGKSLLMIINDILDFSKIESGKLEWTSQTLLDMG